MAVSDTQEFYVLVFTLQIIFFWHLNITGGTSWLEIALTVLHELCILFGSRAAHWDKHLALAGKTKMNKLHQQKNSGQYSFELQKNHLIFTTPEEFYGSSILIGFGDFVCGAVLYKIIFLLIIDKLVFTSSYENSSASNSVLNISHCHSIIKHNWYKKETFFFFFRCHVSNEYEPKRMK